MELTRDFKAAVLQRAKDDPDFRIGLLIEAAKCILDSEPQVAEILLHDYALATNVLKRPKGK